MRNPLLLGALLIAIAFVSCKKDEEVRQQDDTCTETREFWMNGTAGEWAFATDTPCSNLRLQPTGISQQMHDIPINGGYVFLLKNEQQVVDSNVTNHGKLAVTIAVLAPPSAIDTSITATDTVYTLSPNNICSLMKLGKHYQYMHDANAHNANAYTVEYTDADGRLWRTNQMETDSSFVVTSIDGIVSQNPSPGTHLPYCTVKFNYDVLLRADAGTDTVRVKGTGRLGFR